MQKKLYRVKVTLYVMAENESEARLAATKAHFDIFECTARKAESVNSGWENAIPYNAEDERTCAQILSKERQAIHTPIPFLIHTKRNSRLYTRHPVSFVSA